VKSPDLSAALGQTIDPLRLMQRVTDRTLELMAAADGVMVGLANDHGVTYVCGAGHRVSHLGTRVGLESSLSGLAVRTGQLQRSDDTDADPRVDTAACRRLSVASLVCVPLSRMHETLGVLAVNATRPHAFTDDDVEVLTRLADFVSVAIGSACDLSRVSSHLLEFSQPTEASAETAGSVNTSADTASRYVMGVLSPDTVTRIDCGQRIQGVLDDPTVLSMVFQPIVDLVTDEVAAVEALARFDVSPYRAPDVWFHEAHEHGLGVELELLAVTLALAQLPMLPDGVALTINAGPELVMCPRFVNAFLDVPAREVILELTEHTLVDDYPALIAALYELRRRGTRLSIDDTGSGFSSLAHILKLAPDFIKLDRDLVSGIDVDPVRRALATSLVTFAADTGAEIVAEGVETKDELEVLRRLGVRYAQGYHLGHPSALDALANRRRRPPASLRALHQTS
jgi:EAL domain-containing protein (putative c-di-GMP-specific phosphodiesterase class I)